MSQRRESCSLRRRSPFLVNIKMEATTDSPARAQGSTPSGHQRKELPPTSAQFLVEFLAMPTAFIECDTDTTRPGPTLSSLHPRRRRAIAIRRITGPVGRNKAVAGDQLSSNSTLRQEAQQMSSTRQYCDRELGVESEGWNDPTNCSTTYRTH